MRQVQMVRVTDRFVEVAYNEKGAEADDEFRVKMKEAPHADLVTALEALTPAVIEVLEQPAAFAKGLKVRKVVWTWKYDKEAEEDMPKVTIHATKALKNSNSPWNVISPITAPEGDFAETLELVAEEALAYVDGKRAQGTLPLEGDDEE